MHHFRVYPAEIGTHNNATSDYISRAKHEHVKTEMERQLNKQVATLVVRHYQLLTEIQRAGVGGAGTALGERLQVEQEWLKEEAADLEAVGESVFEMAQQSEGERRELDSTAQARGQAAMTRRGTACPPGPATRRSP